MGFQGSAGYSFRGRLDVGLSYTYSSREFSPIVTANPRISSSPQRGIMHAALYTVEYDEKILSPAVRYHLFMINAENQERSMDLSVGAAYIARSVPGNSYNGEPGRIIQSDYSFDIAVAWHIPLFGHSQSGGTGALYPSLGLTVLRTRKEIEPVLNLGLNFIAGTTGGASFLVAPRAELGDEEFTYYLSFGMLFPTTSP